MWRLITVTFAFLGWSFFALSGGTDYAPAEGSRQAAALMKAQEPEPEISLASAEGAAVLRAQKPDAVSRNATGSVEITLASLSTANDAQPAAAAPAKSIPDPDRLFSNPVQPVPTKEVAAALPVQEKPQDLRQVSATRVNMRNGPGTGYDVLTKLVRGDRVEVLQNPGSGWVKLRVIETDRVGWMAERLLVSVN